jgi:rhodanese-related sulfurtransferase
VRKISTDRLKRMLSERSPPVLINVLDEEEYERRHIPGSQNIPFSDEDFLDRVRYGVDNMNSPIVVYSAGLDCSASSLSARTLGDAGFTRVYECPGGMRAWVAARHEVIRRPSALAHSAGSRALFADRGVRFGGLRPLR